MPKKPKAEFECDCDHPEPRWIESEPEFCELRAKGTEERRRAREKLKAAKLLKEGKTITAKEFFSAFEKKKGRKIITAEQFFSAFKKSKRVVKRK